MMNRNLRVYRRFAQGKNTFLVVLYRKTTVRLPFSRIFTFAKKAIEIYEQFVYNVFCSGVPDTQERIGGQVPSRKELFSSCTL